MTTNEGNLEAPLLPIDDDDEEDETTPAATQTLPPSSNAQMMWWKRYQIHISGCILSSVVWVWVIVLWICHLKSTTGDGDDETGNHAILFPSLNDTLHMAALSQLICAFHSSTDPSDSICRRINERNLTRQDVAFLRQAENATASWGGGEYDAYLEPHIPGDVQCHWYHHDWRSGTQILLMESVVDNYVAIVYGGTDDMRTSLTDVNVLSTTYGLASNGTAVLPTVDPAVRVHAGCTYI